MRSMIYEVWLQKNWPNRAGAIEIEATDPQDAAIQAAGRLAPADAGTVVVCVSTPVETLAVETDGSGKRYAFSI